MTKHLLAGVAALALMTSVAVAQTSTESSTTSSTVTAQPVPPPAPVESYSSTKTEHQVDANGVEVKKSESYQKQQSYGDSDGALSSHTTTQTNHETTTVALPVTSAAANVANPDPELIARWQPCEANTGVTVIVDDQKLGEGKIYVGCALGAQPDGVAALEHAGFELEGTENYGLDFICRIDGEPTRAEQSCKTTPGAGAYSPGRLRCCSSLSISQPSDVSDTSKPGPLAWNSRVPFSTGVVIFIPKLAGSRPP